MIRDSGPNGAANWAIGSPANLRFVISAGRLVRGELKGDWNRPGAPEHVAQNSGCYRRPAHDAGTGSRRPTMDRRQSDAAFERHPARHEPMRFAVSAASNPERLRSRRIDQGYRHTLTSW